MSVVTSDRGMKRLQRGARGRYAPPPQLFPLVPAEPGDLARSGLLVERDPEGAYLIRQRESGRLVARTADSATLQRLVTTLARA